MVLKMGKVKFDNVQRIRENVKRRPDGWGYVHPLTGLLYCSSCGGKLYCHRIYNGKDKPTYVCGNYAKGFSKNNVGTVCESGHRIDAGIVMNLVKETLKSIINFAETDKLAFEKAVKETISAQHTDEIVKQRKRLAICEKRNAELDLLSKKIYEDNALGKLSDKLFSSLSVQYEEEQTALESEIQCLKSSVGKYENSIDNAKKFDELVKRYSDFEELTPAMLNEFVEKIIVHERDRKGSIQSAQTVEIHLNFIGEFKTAEMEIELTEEQKEELRKANERKDRLHQNYLKRKENGKHQEWELRYNERRKAIKAEQREILLASGIGESVMA